MCPQPTKYAECHIFEWNECLKFLHPKPKKNLGMKIPERKDMYPQANQKVMYSYPGEYKGFISCKISTIEYMYDSIISLY